MLGFLATGAVLGPAGLSVIKDLNELDTLGELGISFLLFEQGLELSLDRLKALSKYAFGLGTAQVRFCVSSPPPPPPPSIRMFLSAAAVPRT